jgi:hypothetical protein
MFQNGTWRTPVHYKAVLLQDGKRYKTMQRYKMDITNGNSDVWHKQ